MFRRLFLDTWDGIIPVTGLALTGLAFGLILLRALLMKKPEINRMSHLPLQDDATPPTHTKDHGN